MGAWGRAAVAALMAIAPGCGGGDDDVAPADAGCEPIPALGFCADVLADDVDNPRDVALSPTHLVWADHPHGMTNGTVWILDRASGDVRPAHDSVLPGPRSLALDDESVYWAALGADGAAVYAAPLAGGDRVTLGSGENAPDWVAADDDFLYWIDGADMSIWRARKDGSDDPVALVPGEDNPRFLARAGDHLYWFVNPHLDSRTLVRAGLDGQGREVVEADVPCAGNLTTVGDEVQWLCQVNATGDGTFARVSASGGAPSYEPLPLPGCTGTDGCEGGVLPPTYSGSWMYWSYRDGLTRPWRTRVLRAPASDLSAHETVWEYETEEIDVNVHLAADHDDLYLVIGTPISLVARLAP